MSTPPIYHRLLLAIITILTVAGTDLMAQRFQAVYGAAGCREAGHSGVKQLAGGGYIAVGESYSTTATCGTSDIYVVRTNPDGTLLWSYTYNLSPFDSATNVIETTTGDFVICGVTGPSTPCTNSRDIFLLKINSTGGVLLVNTYGSTFDEMAWGLIETTTGNGTTTNPGDYVVVGSSGPAGSVDGYILRTDQNLNMIWGQTYDAIGAGNRDIFYSVCEATLSSLASTGADLVAVGVSGPPTTTGNNEVFVVRVSGVDGSINTTLMQGAALYGGPNYDEGRAVIEIQQGASTGNFVIAGMTRSGLLPSGNNEILMLEIGPHPCTMLAFSVTGDNGTTADGALDVKENPFSPAAVHEVIVTGYTNFGNAAVAGQNAFLQLYSTGNMAPVGTGMAYGGVGTDEGWSVNIATNSSATETPGFVVAGFTRSSNLIGTTDPEQMYLIKTDLNLSSLCNEVAFTIQTSSAPIGVTCISVAQNPLTASCWPTAFPATPRFWAAQLCYIYPKAPMVESSATINFSEGAVRSYPNPLSSGQTLTLDFDLHSQMPLEVTISDIMGRTVHQESVTLNAAGAAMHSVKTLGWTPGAYQISVRIGQTIRTTRVVVLDN